LCVVNRLPISVSLGYLVCGWRTFYFLRSANLSFNHYTKLHGCGRENFNSHIDNTPKLRYILTVLIELIQLGKR